MSIFSGWEAGDVGRLRDVLTGSPQGLGMLVVLVLILIALVFLMVHIISHQISGFYVRISGEEETDEEEGPGEPTAPTGNRAGIDPADAQGDPKEKDSQRNGEVLS
ncbi:MAG: hypothetical protein IJ088_14295 [Clostridia bacterium]|nr:hypothetical protein [Clostridia bacterium]